MKRVSKDLKARGHKRHVSEYQRGNPKYTYLIFFQTIGHIYTQEAVNSQSPCM